MKKENEEKKKRITEKGKGNEKKAHTDILLTLKYVQKIEIKNG